MQLVRVQFRVGSRLNVLQQVLECNGQYDDIYMKCYLRHSMLGKRCIYNAIYILHSAMIKDNQIAYPKVFYLQQPTMGITFT